MQFLERTKIMYNIWIWGLGLGSCSKLSNVNPHQARCHFNSLRITGWMLKTRIIINHNSEAKKTFYKFRRILLGKTVRMPIFELSVWEKQLLVLRFMLE